MQEHIKYPCVSTFIYAVLVIYTKKYNYVDKLIKQCYNFNKGVEYLLVMVYKNRKSVLCSRTGCPKHKTIWEIVDYEFGMQ